MPETEGRGRKQTSLVSVGILPMPPKKVRGALLPESELEVITQNGGGPGGQHQNKTASAVRMKHLPTGLSVFINGRCQHRNREDAHNILSVRVNEKVRMEKDSQYAAVRRAQMGDGGRGAKIRTYNYLENRVADHRNNVKVNNVDAILGKGRFGLLY